MVYFRSKKSAEKELDVSGNAYVQDMWTFIDDKLGDDGQTIKVDTLYKNFMGIGGPKDYGLTRRMVQIYLLCLVRDGRVRITVGAKARLASPMLDYSNIADVEFSTKVLDALGEVQKVAKPENWEVLRPYAEKLLGIEIPSTQDDALITEYRAKLRQLFAQEKEASSRTASRAQGLFDILKTDNPYEPELAQVVKLFSANVEGGDDIHLILYALKEAMNYQAFDTNKATPAEVDDLANRLKNYRDVRAFLEYEPEMRTAHAYCAVTLGDARELAQARKAIEGVRAKLLNLKEYIDSDVQLLDDASRRKMEVFLNPTVRERLEQGKTEPSIAGLLAYKTTEALRAYLIKAVQETPGTVDIINRYLKRIVVKRVRIADFRPKVGTIQKDQVGEVAEEFGRFLEKQFTDHEGDDDALPMLQLE
ncbi:MAG: hypothetical protein AUK24_04065 [Syntrophaceae bacterium CG2_30_49_12]|nr:MAG: hypothetical protein AUK24_04065 [Syntrophaceae bacterium CG2_30_49_12]